jgi:hypothetical protein
MGLFRKRKKMVDVRELQKRGIVRIPRNRIEVPTDKQGFVNLGSSLDFGKTKQGSEDNEKDGNFLSFMDNPATSSSGIGQASTDGLRKISTQISDLDNKIYKLEQRIELLERKLGLV